MVRRIVPKTHLMMKSAGRKTKTVFVVFPKGVCGWDCGIWVYMSPRLAGTDPCPPPKEMVHVGGGTLFCWVAGESKMQRISGPCHLCRERRRPPSIEVCIGRGAVVLASFEAPNCQKQVLLTYFRGLFLYTLRARVCGVSISESFQPSGGGGAESKALFRSFLLSGANNQYPKSRAFPSRLKVPQVLFPS